MTIDSNRSERPVLGVARQVQPERTTAVAREEETIRAPSDVRHARRADSPTPRVTSWVSEQALRESGSLDSPDEASSSNLAFVDEESAWGETEWKTITEPAVRLVDGGAFAWVYGLVPIGAWYDVRNSYKKALICWDSDESIRRDFYPDYKGRRIKRRTNDPTAAERRLRVESFKMGVQGDSTISGCTLPGYEADDLVALHYLQAVQRGERVQVFGVDKDLLQVPGLAATLRGWDGRDESRDLTSYPRRAPLFWPGTRNHRDLLLAQLLFGDRSDSIPRLLARGDGRTAQRLHGADRPISEAVRTYGRRAVRRNLYLLLMPHPSLRTDWSEIEADLNYLANLIDEDRYWNPDSFPHTCRIGTIQ